MAITAIHASLPPSFNKGGITITWFFKPIAVIINKNNLYNRNCFIIFHSHQYPSIHFLTLSMDIVGSSYTKKRGK